MSEMKNQSMHIITVREAKAGLRQAMDDVCRDHQPTVIVRRRGNHVVLLSLEDFNSMNETLYLLGSASNATRLRASVAQQRAGKLVSKCARVDNPKTPAAR